MASLKALRAKLAEQAATVASDPKLTGYAKPTGNINLPCAIVLPKPVDFNVTMGRTTNWSFHVLLLVAAGTLDLMADKLDDFCDDVGESSLREAMESDRKLGGIADWIDVQGIVAYGDVEYAGKHYLGARFALEVQTNADDDA